MNGSDTSIASVTATIAGLAATIAGLAAARMRKTRNIIHSPQTCKHNALVALSLFPTVAA